MLCRNSVFKLINSLSLPRVTVCRSPFCVLTTERYGVIHDRQQRCFTVRLSAGGLTESAVLNYNYKTDRHVHLLSTVVPESFRGQGVAANLAKAALDFVVEEKLKATIFCWYIKKYVEENPQHGYEAYIED